MILSRTVIGRIMATIGTIMARSKIVERRDPGYNRVEIGYHPGGRTHAGQRRAVLSDCAWAGPRRSWRAARASRGRASARSRRAGWSPPRPRRWRWRRRWAARSRRCSGCRGRRRSPEREGWAWPPPSPSWRYWRAEVGGRRYRYPVEVSMMGLVPHDGMARDGTWTSTVGTIRRGRWSWRAATRRWACWRPSWRGSRTCD